jgi:hypothetical protein
MITGTIVSGTPSARRHSRMLTSRFTQAELSASRLTRTTAAWHSASHW